MRKGRRSAERLSYWPALRSQVLTRGEQNMARWLAVNHRRFARAAKVMISMLPALLIALTLSARLHAQGPSLTTISDTVYRADGTAASGTVLISWPSFQTAEGDAVAAGNLAVTIGPLGAFTAQLVPNVGATPAGTYYVEVSYRGQGHAMARVINSASIAASQHGGDNGVRGSVREIGIPVPRTSADCETAALALLDDAGQGWAGEYQVWSKFLPGGAADIFPGDGLAVNVPSRMATFTAVVREVDLEIADIAGENMRYTLRFVDAGDPSLDFAFVTALVKQTQVLTPTDVSMVGNVYLADLTDAEVTNVTSTTVTVDVGGTLPSGGGIEVRYSDSGWGAGYDGNLVGRFTNSSFTLTRYARAQNYFLRSYDGNAPAKYSRYSTALYVDYPL